MTCNVLMGTLNPSHSLTHSLTYPTLEGWKAEYTTYTWLNGNGNVDLYSAYIHETYLRPSGIPCIVKGYRSFTCTPCFSSTSGMRHSCVWLPSHCWYSFPDPGPCAGSGIVRIDPLRFLAGCRKRRLNQALSVLSLSLGFF